MTTKPLSNTQIALTFGDTDENHNGMEMLGNIGDKGTGITKNKLISLKDYFINLDYSVDYYYVNHPYLEYDANIL